MKKIGMIICSSLLALLLVACGQKTYAGVQMDNDKYNQLMQGKQNIDDLLNSLKKFNYRKDSSAEKIYQDADSVMNENTKGLSIADKEKLDIKVDNSTHGIKGIVQDAVQNKYSIDGSVASQFHKNFDVIVNSTAKAVTNSDAQAIRIADELNKELNIEKRLYNLGTQHE